MNSSIFFRTRFLISGSAVMQELEIGVILEMYLFLLQSRTEPQEDRRIYLVWVTPVSRMISKYLSTSLTGSTGSLHEMKITSK